MTIRTADPLVPREQQIVAAATTVYNLQSRVLCKKGGGQDKASLFLLLSRYSAFLFYFV